MRRMNPECLASDPFGLSTAIPNLLREEPDDEEQEEEEEEHGEEDDDGDEGYSE